MGDTQPNIEFGLPINCRKYDFFSPYTVQAGERRLIESAKQLRRGRSWLAVIWIYGRILVVILPVLYNSFYQMLYSHTGNIEVGCSIDVSLIWFLEKKITSLNLMNCLKILEVKNVTMLPSLKATRAYRQVENFLIILLWCRV